jgi:hypothetical protein
MIRNSFALSILLACACLAAPSNDSPKNLPPEPPEQPVPFLSGQDAIKTFKVPAGFHVELVAQEPMVEHPVQMQFDGDGRLWVVEMRDYMPNPEGKGEDRSIGRVSILEDTDGDGKMDKSTIFLDHLVLPRGIGLFNGGALVAEPPKLTFYKLGPDGKAVLPGEVIATDYGLTGNPEHQPNGLMWDIDNWIYNANYEKRFRFADGKWISDYIPDLGQYGLSQDNWGRRFSAARAFPLSTPNAIHITAPPAPTPRSPNRRTAGRPIQRPSTAGMRRSRCSRMAGSQKSRPLAAP